MLKLLKLILTGALMMGAGMMLALLIYVSAQTNPTTTVVAIILSLAYPVGKALKGEV